ncbi:unnamed protein product [Cunninghamella echinulata]
MDTITRQTTTQSNNSLLVVALDQNGPMISHTIETIHYHDEATEEEGNNNTNKNTSLSSLSSLKKSVTLQSDKTMPPPTSPSSQIDQSSLQVNNQHHHSKSISSLSIHHHHRPNTSLTPWKFWKKNASKVDPKLLSNTKKNFILFIVASAGCSSPLASTIYLPALVSMQEAFHTTDTTMNASIAIFTFFTAFFPLLWAALAERFGRRKIYLVSFIITTIGSICCGLSINIVMLIVFRAFSAIGSSSTMSMGAGTLSDVFEIHERGRAFAWYIIGPLFGPCFGPIIGGLLNNAFGFRSIFYFLGIINFLILLNIFFFLPDTDSVSKRKKSNIINPFSAMNLFLYKNIALCVAFLGILFFSFYLVNANFSRSYASIYGFESSIVGVCYLPNAFGCAIGGIAGGRLSDKRYIRNAKKLTEKSTVEEDEEKGKGMASDNNNNNDQSQQEKKEKASSSSTNKTQQPYPEMRLGGILFYGSIILQLIAITGFGWCIQVKTHFAYGLVCQFFYGMGLMVTNVILSTYMVDCFRHRGASVTACNNLTRYLLAGIGSLVSSDLERGMGSGPMYTFLGALLTLFGVNLILIQWKGNTWRYEKMEKQQEKEKELKAGTFP